MRNTTFLHIFLIAIILTVIGCGKDPIIPVDEDPEDSLLEIPYEPTNVEIQYPEYTSLILGNSLAIPKMDIPQDNPLTEEGIDLGKHLFYDRLLSADYSMSCSSCHLQRGSFTDNFATSRGVDGISGRRSSMSLFNIGFTNNGLFWDGRSETLEEQALLPVIDEIELHNNWDTVVNRLQKTDLYPEKFRRAFGIEKKSEITKELAAKALAQFQRSIYSFESKFDKYLKGEAVLTDDELYGLEMYVDAPDATDAQCAHCHNLPLMTSDDYFNNGLQEAATLDDFEDLGRGVITGRVQNGFFRAPTLRNIEYSAPYMHDGSLQTLDDVIDHYASGGKESPNKDPLLDDIFLTEYDKEALKAFLLTLSDEAFINDEAFKDPFE